MKAQTKIVFFDENGNKFFGEGPARLLHAIEEHGSLRTAALSMDMAYTKALKILKNAETALGFIAFLIGNEFRLSQLKKTGKQAAVIGIFQAVLTTLG